MTTTRFSVIDSMTKKETAFEPSEKVTYNGRKGLIWERLTLTGNCWVFQDRKFQPLNATRKQIASLYL